MKLNEVGIKLAKWKIFVRFRYSSSPRAVLSMHQLQFVRERVGLLLFPNSMDEWERIFSMLVIIIYI